jgi:hypothetical protein
MRADNRFEDIDKGALVAALLALKTCPHCRRDLQPVAGFSEVWGCAGEQYPQHRPETWHLTARER